MQTNTEFFNETFQALTGFSPMAWQSRLYKRMLANDIPEALSLPTGLGKTSVIPIWLIALCRQAQEDKITLPRRMAYVVDRRTVVDQATTVVEDIRNKLNEGAAPILAKSLRLLSPREDTEESLIGISTLRGELADNAEWRADAARPAITIGTIDMTGSKLLFGGYGDRPNRRAMHAGLLGIDTLLVHDEAHLSPAFSAVLRSLLKAQRNENVHPATSSRKLRVMEMTATTKEDTAEAFRLNTLDETDPVPQARMRAPKSIRLRQKKNKTAAMSLIAKTAASYKDDAAKTLIYVTSPTDAAKIANRLANRQKENPNVKLLTGEMRGQERDKLAESDLMRKFSDPEAKTDETLYLVCTSAGEVGIDIDADHMICDMSSLDSMIQRLGRVNRRGDSADAPIDVVIAGNERNERGAAAELLQRWAKASPNGVIDGSPRNIEKLIAELPDEERASAFSQPPELHQATPIAFDQLSMTSVPESKERNLIPKYLRGVEKREPETAIAWRREARHFNQYTEPRDIERWFQARPIRAEDRLAMPTSRAKTALTDIAYRLSKEAAGRQRSESAFAILIHQHTGECRAVRIDELRRINGDKLEFQTVVLPDDIGGLAAQGVIDPKAVHLPANDDSTSLDVGIWHADRPEEDLPRHVYVSVSTDEESDADFAAGLPDGFIERIAIPIPQNADEENPSRLILYRHRNAAAADDPDYAPFRQTLTEHHRRIKEDISDMAKRLGLPHKLQSALEIAAGMHACGKAALVWQQYAGNINADGSLIGETLAKSENYQHPRMLGGYRHEWGSMEKAKASKEIDAHPEQELILHLISAHHGHCRPNFPIDGYDPSLMTDREANISNTEATWRYAKLQQRFGRWGLAWLEALIKCADAQASMPNN